MDVPVPPDDDDDGDLTGPLGGPEVDYRQVPSEFGRLTESERRVAWAVVRSMATALWVASGVAIGALVLTAVYVERLTPVAGILVALCLATTLALETKARDLHGAEPGRLPD
jgi:hypothetical protein